MKIKELYESVTAQIIADLESGVASWVKPWKSNIVGGILPYNAASKRGYSGINVPILWGQAIKKGYPTMGWMTYRQSQEIGAQVRAGEKATQIVYANKLTVGEDDSERQISYLKMFAVFN